MEQQVVQLLMELNCSHPAVQGHVQEELEQQVSTVIMSKSTALGSLPLPACGVCCVSQTS